MGGRDVGGMNQQTDVRAEIQGTGRKEAKMVSCLGGLQLWRKGSVSFKTHRTGGGGSGQCPVSGGLCDSHSMPVWRLCMVCCSLIMPPMKSWFGSLGGQTSWH